ncbi:MAG: hypothetical protein KBF99_18280 [Leptospiraceae bacterium]|nr:hypothetical protein [Leptospiraceae bacterium]MBK7054158.1 hypothetical protein [Leptospiraceae bacterium]MBK9499718.1 hypothetical protein [Leptospiraceae bacterium]MBL0262379.1 hypothetical protein [Leptospiraceae bacterium]MBP9165134.1 hypothetical protein [Leptospiraceae bacterium]
MNALDLSKVSLLKFNAYYALAMGVYLLISSTLEERFFPNPELAFTNGLFIGLIVQFSILNLRIVLMQKQLKRSGEIQISFAFLSILINIIVLIVLISIKNNFSLVFGFFIAHNLNILNIAFITTRSVKKND